MKINTGLYQIYCNDVLSMKYILLSHLNKFSKKKNSNVKIPIQYPTPTPMKMDKFSKFPCFSFVLFLNNNNNDFHHYFITVAIIICIIHLLILT